MLLLAAGQIKFVYNAYNYSFKIQVFLMLKLFKNIEIHIILSLSCIQKYFSISITYPVHVH